MVKCQIYDQGFYNLFDERESGSSQILCSYLTTRSGVRYDTKNLAWTRRSSNQIRFLSYVSNDFMFRKEISTCNFSMIYGLHMFKADWQWKGNNAGRLITWQHRGYLEVLAGNSSRIWEHRGYLEILAGNSSRIWEHRGYLEVLVGNSSRIWEATNQGACSIHCCRIWSQILRLWTNRELCYLAKVG